MPSHINPTTPWWDNIHFTDEETKAQRGEGAFPSFHRGKVAELEFKPRSADVTHTHTHTYLTKHSSVPGRGTGSALEELSLVRRQMLDQQQINLSLTVNTR